MNKLKSVLNKFLAFLKKSPIAKALCIWIVLLILLALATDKLIMPVFSGHFTSTGAVPNLEGMTQEAAEAALTEAGFKFEWLEEGRYSSQIPEGLVLVQMPAAGRTAKLGRTVKLTKSLGLREVKIPDLRGKSQKQAEISLTRAGLVQAGKKARIGDTVKVVISAGVTTGKVLLPDFTGQVIDNVYPKLEKLGFKVGDIKRVKAENGEAPGTILETAPKHGDYLPPDTKIDFAIAD